MQGWQLTLAIVGTIVTAASAGVGAYVALRKNGRETRSQALDEAKSTVDLQEKQIALLEKALAKAEQQATARDEEHRRREAEWRERESEQNRRIEHLEGDYRALVKTVTSMAYCAKAPNCPDYDAGDRRQT